MSRSEHVTLEFIETLVVPLRTVYGSEVHGISHGQGSDRDEMGFFAPTLRQCTALNDLPSSYQYKSAFARNDAGFRIGNQPKSGVGDLDLLLYDVRHWAKLAIAGNPQVHLPLYVGDEWVVMSNDLGETARRERARFMSSHVASKSLGYMTAQYEQMMGLRGKSVNRPDLVARHGYDTKFAAHMIRLGVQTLSVLNDGVIVTPLPTAEAEYVTSIRNGEVAQSDVIGRYGEIRAEVERRLDNHQHDLPELPDVEWIEDWVYEVIKGASAVSHLLAR